MWCTEDGVQESTIHGRNAMNKYVVMKGTPTNHSTTERRQSTITISICLRKREKLMNAMVQARQGLAGSVD